MADPGLAQGQENHSGSEEQPEDVNNAQNQTAIGEELATKKAECNRVRGGVGNDSLAMDDNFYQRGVL